jgi:hypothetical protein
MKLLLMPAVEVEDVAIQSGEGESENERGGDKTCVCVGVGGVGSRGGGGGGGDGFVEDGLVGCEVKVDGGSHLLGSSPADNAYMCYC